jgi:capsular exopolysaccharide synthesis family protein
MIDDREDLEKQKSQHKEPENRFTVLDYPTGPHASKKGTQSSLLLSFLISILLAFGSGYLLEYLNNTIQTSNDVRTYLNLANIAVIPQIRGPQSLRQIDLKDPTWENYNKLATFVESVAQEQRSRTILITSAKAAEGKSTISSNLGIAMAQGGLRVILIDSDLRKPQYHNIFSCSNERGLSSILSGELDASQLEQQEAGILPSLTDYLQPTEIPTLRVLPSGPIPENPVALLKSNRLPKLLSILNEEADIVIFDSPPLLGVIDAAILGAICDLSILVISEGQVTRGEATQTKSALDQVNANIIGTILNKAEHQPEAYYYYYYRYRGSG